MTEFTTVTLNDGIEVVRPEGRLNMVSAPRLTAAVTDLVARGHTRIIVDLGGTDFIDSSGLGALVACLKKARQGGGDLRIAAPNTQIQTVLNLTNLGRVLQPSASVEAAQAGF